MTDPVIPVKPEAGKPAPGELELRLLTPADAPAWVDIRREMVVESPWSFLGSPDDDFFTKGEEIAAKLAGEDNEVAAAFVDGRLRATAGIYRVERKKCRHRANVWGVYVGPELRGRGIGQRVMELAIGVARRWVGVDVVSLSYGVRAPEAGRLYESLGFVAWGVEPDAIRIGTESEDEVYMQLRL